MSVQPIIVTGEGVAYGWEGFSELVSHFIVGEVKSSKKGKIKAKRSA